MTLVTATAGLLTLSLAACGASSEGEADSSGNTELTVAVSPGAATAAPIYLAKEKGIFEEHGLDVELTVLSGGTVAIPQVLNGQTQFSMASFGPVVHAVGQGLPIKMIGSANVMPTDADTKYQAIVKSSEAGIEDINEARTFAAGSTEPDPVHRYSIEQIGGDYTALDILQVSDPAIGDALKDGNADIAILREPFLSAALEGGGVELMEYITPELSLPGTPGAVFIGAEQDMIDNPEITLAFTSALEDAYAYANANMDEVAASVVDTGLTDQELPRVALGEYPKTLLDREKVDLLLQLFIEYEAAEPGVTIERLVHQPE